MKSDTKYERARSRDIPTAARMIALAFAGTLDGVTKWLTDNGIENIRVVREGRQIPACLRRISMGQFFGGRSVPLVGIAGVATAPELRGKGHARRMMESCVREMREEGAALGGLYASTQALYRQSGFEQAGHRFITRIPLVRLLGGDKSRQVIVLDESDHNRVKACYTRFASSFNGLLDRTDYVWKRIREMRDSRFQGFGVTDSAGDLSGYLYLAQKRDDTTGRQELHLSDLAFTSESAGRQLIAFLADFEPMGDFVQFGGGPMHPLLTLLPQQRYEVKLKDFWMLRIVDVVRAFEARGYSAASRGSVVLSVRDRLVPENEGRWRIEFERGRAKVHRNKGARGAAIECDIRGLAPLYSGLYSPRQAAILGLCSGEPEALDILGGALGGGTPWMTDHY
ncbi:MAG: GNAT family N-acetyltransferase [Phycisphaerales bacterium]|nr:GNAT family N-acetyltransferase [Planctomycetota bacterium]